MLTMPTKTIEVGQVWEPRRGVRSLVVLEKLDGDRYRVEKLGSYVNGVLVLESYQVEVRGSTIRTDYTCKENAP